MSILQTRSEREASKTASKRNFSGAFIATLYFAAIAIATLGWLYFLLRILMASIAWIVT